MAGIVERVPSAPNGANGPEGIVPTSKAPGAEELIQSTMDTALVNEAVEPPSVKKLNKPGRPKRNTGMESKALNFFHANRYRVRREPETVFQPEESQPQPVEALPRTRVTPETARNLFETARAYVEAQPTEEGKERVRVIPGGGEDNFTKITVTQDPVMEDKHMVRIESHEDTDTHVFEVRQDYIPGSGSSEGLYFVDSVTHIAISKGLNITTRDPATQADAVQLLDKFSQR